MMMYKCVLERTGDTKRMSRLDFWIFGFFDFVVVFVFLIFVIFFFFLDFFSKVRFKRTASVIKTDDFAMTDGCWVIYLNKMKNIQHRSLVELCLLNV
jgi:hypothetical protein